MAIYVTCPHCHHPTVLPSPVQGRRYRCRQCNDVYVLVPGQHRRNEGTGADARGTGGARQAV